MKKILTNIRYFILIILCITFAAGVLLKVMSFRRLNTSYEEISSKESATSISNPFCGFYQLESYTPNNKTTLNDTQKWWNHHYGKSLDSLTLLEINLKNYSKKNISTSALDQINLLLEQCRAYKIQVILRFTYDTTGHAKSTEPHSINQITRHISQLSKTVNAHKDCVYILQGFLVGDYGEMHDSKFVSTSQLQRLAQEMNKNFDASIYLAVRTPSQLRSILKSSTPGVVYDKSLTSLNKRLGLFNDGMFGSDNDLGTYDDTPLTKKSSYDEAGTRNQELNYQDKLCQTVPNGGEVIYRKNPPQLMDVIDDLSTMHVSYLNKAYDPKMIQTWQRSTYSGDGVFSGTNGYYYIKSHLGYRYVLKNSHLDFHSFVGDEAYLYLTIENSGFAPAYRSFQTYLDFRNPKTGETKETKINIDNRSIAGNDSSTFKIALNIRAFKKGTYTVSLKMKDPYTQQFIQFANEGYENSDQVSFATLTLH